MWGGGERGDGVGTDMQHVASQVWQHKHVCLYSLGVGVQPTAKLPGPKGEGEGVMVRVRASIRVTVKEGRRQSSA